MIAVDESIQVMGINAPRKHQAIISQLIYGLMERYKQKTSSLFPYPETMIDESQTSPVPDVMLIDEKGELTQIIIEVTHTQGVKRDIKKLKKMMDTYDVPEGFVYDYKLDKWVKVVQQREVESSYSDVLQLDLDSLL